MFPSLNPPKKGYPQKQEYIPHPFSTSQKTMGSAKLVTTWLFPWHKRGGAKPMCPQPCWSTGCWFTGYAWVCWFTGYVGLLGLLDEAPWPNLRPAHTKITVCFAVPVHCNFPWLSETKRVPVNEFHLAPKDNHVLFRVRKKPIWWKQVGFVCF